VVLITLIKLHPYLHADFGYMHLRACSAWW